MAKNGHQGDGGGRPHKEDSNPDVVRKLEEAASLDCSIDEMAFHAEISKTTYYAIVKRDPRLLARLEALRQKPFMNCRATIQKAISKGDGALALKYLERKLKREFAALQMVESDITGNIQTNDPAVESLKNDISGLNEAVAREMAEIAKLQKSLKAKPRKK